MDEIPHCWDKKYTILVVNPNSAACQGRKGKIATAVKISKVTPANINAGGRGANNAAAGHVAETTHATIVFSEVTRCSMPVLWFSNCN